MILTLFVVTTVTTCHAAEVVLLDDQLLVKGVDDEAGLGVFDIVLCYVPDVAVNSVEVLPPFMGVYNIQNSEGITIVTGVQVSKILKGDVPVARIDYEKEQKIQIYVRELASTQGKGISCDTPEYTGNVPKEGTTFPEIAEYMTRDSKPVVEVASIIPNNSIIENIQNNTETIKLAENKDIHVEGSSNESLNGTSGFFLLSCPSIMMNIIMFLGIVFFMKKRTIP